MHHDDPADMSTDDRLEELAALLAAGFLRLKRRTGCLPAATSESGPWRLVWAESHPTRSASVVRERHIKAMKSARWIRENLLNGRASPGAPGLTARF